MRPLAAGVLVVAAMLPRSAPAQLAQAGGEGLFDVRSAAVPDSGWAALCVSGLRYTVETSREPGATADRDVLDAAVQLSVRWRGRVAAFGRFGATRASNDSSSFAASRDGVAGVQLEMSALPLGIRSGALAAVTLPWGDGARGLSQEALDPSFALLVTVPLGESGAARSVLHLNAGRTWRRGGVGHGYEGAPLWYLDPVHPAGEGDRWDLRAAFETGSSRITMFAEVVLDTLVDERIRWSEGPIFLTPGFRLNVGGEASLLLAAKVSLAADHTGTTDFRVPRELFPEWQFGFCLGWAPHGTS
ncbi:MAG: hypothetical protein ACT4PE_16190 [Candidatus Eiseniibacteriota bacterium]